MLIWVTHTPTLPPSPPCSETQTLLANTASLSFGFRIGDKFRQKRSTAVHCCNLSSKYSFIVFNFFATWILSVASLSGPRLFALCPRSKVFSPRFFLQSFSPRFFPQGFFSRVFSPRFFLQSFFSKVFLQVFFFKVLSPRFFLLVWFCWEGKIDGGRQERNIAKDSKIHHKIHWWPKYLVSSTDRIEKWSLSLGVDSLTCSGPTWTGQLGQLMMAGFTKYCKLYTIEQNTQLCSCRWEVSIEMGQPWRPHVAAPQALGFPTCGGCGGLKWPPPPQRGAQFSVGAQDRRTLTQRWAGQRQLLNVLVFNQTDYQHGWMDGPAQAFKLFNTTFDLMICS